MKTLPTVLVCTMYCGEPDFEHCVAMLKAQNGIILKHVVIANKPELEAHNELYATLNNADRSWFRVKIDADVVLLHENILAEMIEFWQARPHLDWIDPPVHDHLTKTTIKAGIAFYTSKVKFSPQSNPLKCDRGVVSAHKVMMDYPTPVAHHMLYADERTAFHFGLHRGLKGQGHIEKAVERANIIDPHPAREAALQGFAEARSERYANWHLGQDTHVPNDHNYGDAKFEEALQKLNKQVPIAPPAPPVEPSPPPPANPAPPTEPDANSVSLASK